jgi:NADH-quinone oxidoreductase subunit C
MRSGLGPRAEGRERRTDVGRGADIVKVATFLRDDARCQFWSLLDVTAIDWPGREHRLMWSTTSLARKNKRVRLKIVVGEGTAVASIIEVFPSANWFERETYDLYGVLFTGHPDMRRLLTDYGFEGHSTAQGFPAHRFCRSPLRRRTEARGQRAGAAGSGVPQFRFPLAVEGPGFYGLPGDEKAKKANVE